MEELRIEGYNEGSRWYQRDGHFYVVVKSRPTSTSLRCADSHCPARWLQKNGQTGLGPVIPDHDHEPTPWLRERNIMFAALKRRALEEDTALNIIYEQEAARHVTAAPHLLFEAVMSSLRTWRRKLQPALPHTLEEYAISLREHVLFHKIYLNTVTAGGAVAVILCMDNFGECLRQSDFVLADGTFQTVPAGLPAAQILTIHSVIQGHYFHPVVALMANRTRPLYEAVFRAIWQAAGNPVVNTIITDYELALQEALRAVTNSRIQGCLFHFSQALVRRARREGIRVSRNSPGWSLVRLYVALAFLPADSIPLALVEIPIIARDNGFPFNERFSAYFQSYWMLRVGPVTFSVHGSPHRTSNVAESFHASMRRSMGPNPNIWRFTGCMNAKFTVSSARYFAQRNGRGIRRRNRERYYVRQLDIIASERALAVGDITLREFLVTVSRVVDVDVRVADMPERDDEGPNQNLPPFQVPERDAEGPNQNLPPFQVPERDAEGPNQNLPPFQVPESDAADLIQNLPQFQVPESDAADPNPLPHQFQDPAGNPFQVPYQFQNPAANPIQLPYVFQNPTANPIQLPYVFQNPTANPIQLPYQFQGPGANPFQLSYQFQEAGPYPRVPVVNAARCLVCFDNVPCYVFIPCGHVICQICFVALEACFLCSMPIERVIHISL